jgi:membrane protease YdiL (CAAX protease family)
MTRPNATLWQIVLLALGVATWLGCFAVLARWGTWSTFAVAGPVLAMCALAADPDAMRLLRPSIGTVSAGLVAGVGMLAMTHAIFAGLAALVPDTRTQTIDLYRLLAVGGFSPAARAALVAVIASSEEIVFRGSVVDAAGVNDTRRHRLVPDGRGVVVITVLAACYASSVLALGSPLLVLCAFACGLAWGALRYVSRSLAAPIAAHVIWDIGVLAIWPLV